MMCANCIDHKYQCYKTCKHGYAEWIDAMKNGKVITPKEAELKAYLKQTEGKNA